MRNIKNCKLLQKEEVSHVNEIKIAKMVYGTLMRADQRLKLCERKQATEAATGGVLYKKLFLKILQYSQGSPATLLNRDSNTDIFLRLLQNF